MPIDTAEDRRSVAGVGFYIFLGVTPELAKDAEWRQQAGYSYSGIAAGLPPTGDTGSDGSQGAVRGRWPGITPSGILGGPGVY